MLGRKRESIACQVRSHAMLVWEGKSCVACVREWAGWALLPYAGKNELIGWAIHFRC
jgi:hypothetical protein